MWRLPATANNNTVIWSSSDNSIATVSAEGIVTGVSEGNVIITVKASDGSGVSDSVEIIVKDDTEEENKPSGDGNHSGGSGSGNGSGNSGSGSSSGNGSGSSGSGSSSGNGSGSNGSGSSSGNGSGSSGSGSSSGNGSGNSGLGSSSGNGSGSSSKVGVEGEVEQNSGEKVVQGGIENGVDAAGDMTKEGAISAQVDSQDNLSGSPKAELKDTKLSVVHWGILIFVVAIILGGLLALVIRFIYAKKSDVDDEHKTKY